MPNWLLNTQTGLSKFHPSFIKGLISICISAVMYLSTALASDDIINLKILTRREQFILLIAIGFFGVVLNNFRDALSAYYTDKQPKPEVPLDIVQVEADKVASEEKKS